jgi:transcription elongation factor Elf1
MEKMTNENTIEYGQCEYCGYEAEMSEMENVPAVDDDAAWFDLAEKHSDSCEWVQTRAHRMES